MTTPETELRLRLRPGREKSVRDGHPWLFSGAIADAEGPADAPVARILAANGESLGVGFHSPKSDLRVRLLDGWGGAVDQAFFASRLAEALALRQALVPPDTTGYRLLNAEGDGLPGWTLDRFCEVIVSQVTVAGLEALRGEAYAALAALLPGRTVLQRNNVPSRRGEGLSAADELVVSPAGAAPPVTASFREHGLAFTADLSAGQKTGFYFDQRDSRALVRDLAAGRRTLDLFAYVGAFAAYALAGGASQVVAVESSAKLAAAGGDHVTSNGLDGGLLDWQAADVFVWLRETAPDSLFDLVVCDPPPLVRRRNDVEAGARAYKDLNRLALRRLAPGGLYLTFTCSAGVDAKLFRQILFAAAREAGVELQLLRPLAAALDHPVAVTHPQGEYLKGWLCRRRGAD